MNRKEKKGREGKTFSDIDLLVRSVERWLGNPISRALLKHISKRDKDGETIIEKVLRKYTGEKVKVNGLTYWILKKIIEKELKEFDASVNEIKESLKKPIIRRGIVNILEGIAYWGVTKPQITAAPFLIVWNFTKQCNLRCRHCYENAGPKAAPDELTTKEAKRIIDEFRKLGVVAIAFSGGEPLMRKDFFEIAKYAWSRDFYVSMATNGTLITPEVAKKIKEAGIEYVEISLDGFQETHDKFRGVKGAWRRAVEGIKNCVAEDISTGVATTITKYNLKEIPEFLEFVERELHPRRFIAFNFVPTGRGKEMIEADLSPKEREDLLALLYSKLIDPNFHMDVLSTAPQYAVTSLTFFDKFGGPLVATHFINQKAAEMLKGKARALAPFLGGCGAGRLYAALEPNGDLFPCVFIPVKLGNLRKDKLEDIWKHSPVLKKIRERDLFEGCGNCPYKEICGGCRARAYGYFGNLQGADPGCVRNQKYWEKLKKEIALLE
ncbi:radical SAM protein [bacterium]|nr:radical SAM protein [bacterium]